MSQIGFLQMMQSSRDWNNAGQPPKSTWWLGEVGPQECCLGFRNLGSIYGGISLQRGQAEEDLSPGQAQGPSLGAPPSCHSAGETLQLLIPPATEHQFTACNMLSPVEWLTPSVLSTINSYFPWGMLLFAADNTIALTKISKHKMYFMAKIYSGF